MQLKIKINSPNAESQECTLMCIPSNGNMIDELIDVVREISIHSPDVKIRIMYLDHDKGIAQSLFKSDNLKKFKETGKKEK